MKTRLALVLFHVLLMLLPTVGARAQPARSPMSVSPAMLARVDQESEAVLLRLYRLLPGRAPCWPAPSAR